MQLVPAGFILTQAANFCQNHSDTCSWPLFEPFQHMELVPVGHIITHAVGSCWIPFNIYSWFLSESFWLTQLTSVGIILTHAADFCWDHSDTRSWFLSESFWHTQLTSVGIILTHAASSCHLIYHLHSTYGSNVENSNGRWWSGQRALLSNNSKAAHLVMTRPRYEFPGNGLFYLMFLLFTDVFGIACSVWQKISLCKLCNRTSKALLVL